MEGLALRVVLLVVFVAVIVVVFTAALGPVSRLIGDALAHNMLPPRPSP